MKNSWSKPICLFTFLILVAAMPAAAQMRTVQPGDDAVVGTSLEPYHARYEDVFVKDGEEVRAWQRQVSLEEANFPAGPGLRRSVAMITPGGTVYDEVQFLRSSFLPVARIVSALTILHKVEVFDADGNVRGYQIAKDGSEAQKLEVATEGKRFDGGSLDLIIATLPLAAGFEATFATFSSDMPSQPNTLARVEVTGREKLEMAGREWDTWIVEVRQIDKNGEALKLPNGQSMPRVRKWIAREPPYQIKTEWGADHRVELVEWN